MNDQHFDAKEVQQQTEQLKRNLAELNGIIVQLGKSQQSLGEVINKSAESFRSIGDAADDAGDALEDLSKQLKDNAGAFDNSKKAIDQNKQLLNDLKAAYDVLSKTQAGNSEQLKTLGNDINLLTKNIGDQVKALAKSQETFDYHKASVAQLQMAMDKLKASNKDFGPVLEDVTKGFNFMKDGLAVVKDGFTGIGGAIKATGFGLLVLVLQSVTEYLTKTSQGAKVLRGGIAAISLVIKTVKDTVSNLLLPIGGQIVNAFMHPADTIKKVWNAVINNLTNRFKGIAVFFDGLMHGDFKTMGNGLIQMGTGVTDGVNKINQSFQTVKKDIQEAGKAIAGAYEKGAKASDKAVKTISKNNTKLAGHGHKPPVQKRPETEDLKGAYQSTLITQEDPDDEKIDKRKNSSTTTPTKTELTPQQEKVQQEDAIILSHNSGDWQTEFKLRHAQLEQEREQAKTAAQQKGESVLKVDQEFKERQRQLDKARLDAQFANQQNYLRSVDAMSNALGSIFGKNTVAAKAAFKAHQAAAAGQVIIDTQKSIMGIWSADAGLPFIGVPKAIAETAIAVATGAASLASIVRQKPGFAQGGQYRSDGRGALLAGYSRADDTNAYLRSGEAVVVSEAMRNPWARNLVSAINVAHGGRDFSTVNTSRGYAVGGIFTDGGSANRYYSQPANDVKDLANTLAYQMINNFPPIYVDVKDVNTQQSILAQTVNRVNL